MDIMAVCAAIQPFTGASICTQLRPSASLNLPVALTVVPFFNESICSKLLPAPLLTTAFWFVPVSMKIRRRGVSGSERGNGC